MAGATGGGLSARRKRDTGRSARARNRPAQDAKPLTHEIVTSGRAVPAFRSEFVRRPALVKQLEAVLVVVPWIAMMLISTFEYGWGTAEDTLGQAYHWNLNSLSWLFTVWVVFESGASFPTGWLRERGYLSARKAVTMRIRDAVRGIESGDPALGRHLRNAVKTGRMCVYEPDTEVRWQT